MDPVTAVELTGTPAQVYNFRSADHHTYFVGDDDWGFSVWVHNAKYSLRDEYLGATPGKFSRTGMEVQEAMKASGDLRVKKGITEIRYTAPGAKRGKWYVLDETIDMAHRTDVSVSLTASSIFSGESSS